MFHSISSVHPLPICSRSLKSQQMGLNSFQIDLSKMEIPFDSDSTLSDMFSGLPPLVDLLDISNPSLDRSFHQPIESFDDILGDSNVSGGISSFFKNIAMDTSPVEVRNLGEISEEDECFSYSSSSASSAAHHQIHYYCMSSNEGDKERNSKAKKKMKKRRRPDRLELSEIRQFFDRPILRAAKELNVGLTVLKKRCRELGIVRWPHRKIKSLNSLINSVQGLGMPEEVTNLEEHKRHIETEPDAELTERTKRLRQACFKANYKKRRSLN